MFESRPPTGLFVRTNGNLRTIGSEWMTVRGAPALRRASSVGLGGSDVRVDGQRTGVCGWFSGREEDHASAGVGEEANREDVGTQAHLKENELHLPRRGGCEASAVERRSAGSSPLNRHDRHGPYENSTRFDCLIRILYQNQLSFLIATVSQADQPIESHSSSRQGLGGKTGVGGVSKVASFLQVGTPSREQEKHRSDRESSRESGSS